MFEFKLRNATIFQMVKYIVVTDVNETWCEAIPETWIYNSEDSNYYAYFPEDICAIGSCDKGQKAFK